MTMTPKSSNSRGGDPTRTVQLGATVALDLHAAAEAGTEPPRRPSFTITGYTGAVMQAEGFFSPVIVDLASLQAERDPIPVLFDHDSTRIIGQTDPGGVTIDASGVRITGTITG